MKHIFVYLGLVGILSSCQLHTPQPYHSITAQVSQPSTAPKPAPKQQSHYDYDPLNPVKTVDETVDIIISQLSQDDINYLKNSTEADSYMLHFGLGMWIRNSFGLRKGNEALLKNACGGKICYPDDASTVIISKLLDRLKSSKH